MTNDEVRDWLMKCRKAIRELNKEYRNKQKENAKRAERFAVILGIVLFMAIFILFAMKL